MSYSSGGHRPVRVIIIILSQTLHMLWTVELTLKRVWVYYLSPSFQSLSVCLSCGIVDV
jgi:hypothetical protein